MCGNPANSETYLNIVCCHDLMVNLNQVNHKVLTDDEKALNHHMHNYQN